MPKVLLLTRYDRLGASSRVRFLQFLPGLAQRGFEVDVSPLLDDVYVRSLYGGRSSGAGSILRAYVRRTAALMRRRRYDLIWLEKEALPWIPGWIEALMRPRVPFVVDLDDAWFHRYEHHPYAAVRALLSGKIDAVMRAASVVVAGNDYVAERARSAGARQIEIIPSVVDLARYPPMATDPTPSPERPIVVGWIGIPLNAHYLKRIEPAFRQFASTRDVRLRVIGSRAPAEFAGLPVDPYAWSEAREIDRIGGFDIGVMPLDDTPWEQGKCAYKLIQMMAAGKPVIASPVGANRRVVQHGVNGFLAETPAEWTAAFEQLAADPAMRNRMGQEARRTVAEGYTLATVLPRLADILGNAARR
jgi:glycosyltransferase involved in cell wall biosynthesis